MVANDSLVSIIMATYNRSHLIKETLDSILRQTYQNWECLIIDDGSNDDAENVILPYVQNDPRFKFFKRSTDYKKGLPGARNMGLDLAKGEAIIFFDDDDIVHPENLSINIKTLDKFKTSFCRYNKKPFFGNWRQQEAVKINSNPKNIDIQDIDEMITGKLPFASCTVMWDRKCFENERFNEDLHYAEEWELYSKILAKGTKGVSIDDILYYNRKHENSNTGEYYNYNPLRRNSKIEAVTIVIQNLNEKNLLSDLLVKYFIRLGFYLKAPSVINEILNRSEAGFFKKIKYKFGYKIYPIIRPLFLLKKAAKEK